MEMNTRKIDNVLIVELNGDIMGGAESGDFRNIIYDAIENDTVNIVIDLANVNWMNSSGLGLLISGLTTIRSSGGDMRLANVSDRVRRTLEITKLESVFSSFESIDEAVNSY
ncbi:STAS domain-containing protein [candidate division KSB1 bacterium]|nr:STAS domain-containing protein [candidate division KSB1 bacterium]MBL7092595.1 STAS domain-containing protein [candidate division KSB1 bacterium]